MVEKFKYPKTKHRYGFWLTWLLALVILIVTVRRIVLPIDALEDYKCGLEEHIHSADCYEWVTAEHGEDAACTLETLHIHSHTEQCYDKEGYVVCGYADYVIHVHDDICYDENENLRCELEEIPAHEHDDSCYANTDLIGLHSPSDAVENLICEEEERIPHIHKSACYDGDGILICKKLEIREHQHTKTCFSGEMQEKRLICEIPEHEHSDACLEEPEFMPCGYADYVIHEHDENCYDEDGNLWCGLPEIEEHIHEEACYRIMDIIDEDTYHIHTDACYGTAETDDEVHTKSNAKKHSVHTPSNTATWSNAATSSNAEKVLICGMEETKEPELELICDQEVRELHTHSAECLGEHDEFVCGKPAVFAHQHDAECFDYTQDGRVLNCKYVVHEHTEACYKPLRLTEAEREQVQAVIALIEELPEPEVIAQLLEAYEQKEQYAEYEQCFLENARKGFEVYEQYRVLTEFQKLHVTNAQKLMNLEWLWSAMPLIENIKSDTPTTVVSASTSDFIDLNLYDYGSNINENYRQNNKYPGFQWNGGAYHKNGSTYNRHNIDFIDFGNSMITDFSYGSSKSGTNGISSNQQEIGNKGGAINRLDISSYGTTNRPIGMSTGDPVLQRTLGSDGYPALTDGTSLDYLFKSGTYAKKQNENSIDGLFQQDEESGAYYYNSRWNHAQYGNDKFTLYEQIITPNFIVYPFGNFLPFNRITENENATQINKIDSVGNYMQQVINDLVYASDYSSNTTKQQLVDMLAKYRENLQGVSTSGGNAWTTWSAKDAIIDYFTSTGDNPSDDTTPINNVLDKIYNIDYDVQTNFFFGMEMSMNFMQPKDGMTGNDTNQDGKPDYPMEFYFTGDDDVWVYVDGVLFLDLSGIHRHVGGEIDFVNGEVHYYALDTQTGDVSDTPYQTYTFKELLGAAGKSAAGLNEQGRFKDYTTHEFKFYYMERGSGSSVCRMNFNFPLLRKNSISVSKQLTVDEQDKEILLGNPDFRFQILKAKEDGTKTDELFILSDTNFTIYDPDETEPGIGVTDSDGIFTLKAGQRAEFSGIEENSGSYYVRELLDTKVFEQYGTIQVDGTTQTTSGTVTIGNDTFQGVDSPVKNVSDGTTVFDFNNQVTFKKLGSLELEKKLITYPQTTEAKAFDFLVLLDEEALPVGTVYQVIAADGTESQKIVETEGVVRFQSGEKAVISNIIAGTKFHVKETSESSEGYLVRYGGDETVQADQAGASGVIATDSQVSVVITNEEPGAELEIPIVKNLENPDGKVHTFTFGMVEVKQEENDWIPIEGAQEEKISITFEQDTGESISSAFSLNYRKADLAGEIFPLSRYYRIQEDTDSLITFDTSSYIVEVTISENAETGSLDAAIAHVWKDGELQQKDEAQITFTNTVVRSLVIQKQLGSVIQNAQDLEFEFAVTLKQAEDLLSGSYSAVKTDKNGTDTSMTITFDENGSTKIKLHAEESLQICQIPYGAHWRVEELHTDGYRVKYQIGDDVQNGTCAEGVLQEDTGIGVLFINTSSYELPKTGGSGTISYTLGGLLMVLAAAAGLLVYNKK